MIRQKNLRDAKIIFTVEDNSKELFFLEKSGRYSHSQKYIGNICKENNLYLIEDVAQAHGAEYMNKKVGTTKIIFINSNLSTEFKKFPNMFLYN